MTPDRSTGVSSSDRSLFPLADNVPVGIAAIDDNGRQSYVNEAFARMLGWTREALIGATPPFLYWAPEELPRIEAAFSAALRGLAPAEGVTLRFRRRDGTIFHALVHIGRLGDGNVLPTGWVASITDVSAELAVRHQLELSTRRLTALQHTMSRLSTTLTRKEVADVVISAAIPAVGGERGAVALLNADGSALELVATRGISSAVLERYGRVALNFPFPLSDVVRDRRARFFSTVESRIRHYPHLRELFSANAVGAMASIPLLVGDTLLGAMSINWLREREFTEEEKSFLQLLAHQCALALERARLYEEEQLARREAEHANRAKGDFLAAMSHELRTPLNGIVGYVDLLLLGAHGSLSSEQQRDLERIRFNGRHLASLIEDVLSFARIEAGKLEVAHTLVPVHEVLHAVPQLVAPLMLAKGIEFVSEGCDYTLTALGDHERIVQVCVNLLANAAHATGAGGKVLLTARRDGERVLIRVTDTGVGIPADKLAEIFSPFTQLGRSLTAPRSGSGLGLSISRALAQAMGGELTVESVVGTGSSFTLSLESSGGDHSLPSTAAAGPSRAATPS